MAKLDLNSALRGIHGEIDNWVYKRFGPGMIISRRPTFTRPPTPAQLDHQEAFRAAVAYARLALADPQASAIYAAEAARRGTGVRAFALAVGDFFNPPRVDAIDLTGYHGHVGDVIRVHASDDIGVTALTVVVRDTTMNTVLEQGPAMLGLQGWVYTATVAVPAGHAVMIEAKPKDRPGNEGLGTQAWA